jgi:hypothetical protein
MATNTYYAGLKYNIGTIDETGVKDGAGENDNDTFTYTNNLKSLLDENKTVGYSVFGVRDFRKRNYLDEVLDKLGQSSGDSEYDFQNNPIFVTIGTKAFGDNTTKHLTDDFYGIPLPINSIDFDAITHSRQQLALKIADIDTNENILFVN